MCEVAVFLAPTSFARDRAVEWGVPADRIRVLPLGAVGPTRRRGGAGSAPGSAYVGTMAPHKGVHVLLEAVRGLPGRTWTLDLVRQPRPRPRRTALACARSRSGDPRIRFRGPLASGRVGAHLGLDRPARPARRCGGRTARSPSSKRSPRACPSWPRARAGCRRSSRKRPGCSFLRATSAPCARSAARRAGWPHLLAGPLDALAAQDRCRRARASWRRSTPSSCPSGPARRDAGVRGSASSCSTSAGPRTPSAPPSPRAIPSLDVHVLIVENGSSAAPPAAPGDRLRLPENRGFAGGMNAGLERLLAEGCDRYPPPQQRRRARAGLPSPAARPPSKILAWPRSVPLILRAADGRVESRGAPWTWNGGGSGSRARARMADDRRGTAPRGGALRRGDHAQPGGPGRVGLLSTRTISSRSRSRLVRAGPARGLRPGRRPGRASAARGQRDDRPPSPDATSTMRRATTSAASRSSNPRRPRGLAAPVRGPGPQPRRSR